MNKAKRATPSQGRILVVEDEDDLRELMRVNLEREGYEVECVDDGEQAVRAARRHRPDLVLLDLMLPGMSGTEVYRSLQADAATSGLPVVMVTARDDDADVVAGLEMGADDYVTKPFANRVLTARVRAVLRRRSQAPTEDEQQGVPVLRIDGISIDRDRHEVRVGGEPIELTATEFRLLEMLAGRPGRVFTRQQIISHLHGPAVAVTDRSVDVQVVGLRRKLGDAGAAIQTVRGVGYRFRDTGAY